MTALAVTGLCKSFGDVPVLRGVDLQIGPGELAAILGPSGCGKTTLLRLIAGFDTPDAGTIALGGRTVCEGRTLLPPEQRGVGYVAQEGALFPHLTVAANIAFGLPRAGRRDGRRVDELLELVGLGREHARRHPHELSGGQQQRVALARALAPRPAAVLLDEPFASLDAALRVDTRRAVADALAASGTTALLVTHDQEEALSLADRVGLLREGRIAQYATPAELYTNPADPAVARFLGDVVVLAAEACDGVATCALGSVSLRHPTAAGPVDLLIRPEQLQLHTDETPGARARVEGSSYYGHDATVRLRLLPSGTAVTARCAGHAVPQGGDDVSVTVHGSVLAFPRGAASDSRGGAGEG